MWNFLTRSRARQLAPLAFLIYAAQASADPAGVPLAAAGACAEPRAELQTGPEQAGLQDEFEVAGTPLLHFGPRDVGAPGPEGSAPPAPPGFTRGPCDAPNASCGLDDGRRGLQEGPADPSGPPGTDTRGPQ